MSYLHSPTLPPWAWLADAYCGERDAAILALVGEQKQDRGNQPQVTESDDLTKTITTWLQEAPSCLNHPSERSNTVRGGVDGLETNEATERSSGSGGRAFGDSAGAGRKGQRPGNTATSLQGEGWEGDSAPGRERQDEGERERESTIPEAATAIPQQAWRTRQANGRKAWRARRPANRHKRY
ncbi:uncharacterized protein PADG_04256 [Paracoccidioides brasiliensis Pb18]|uniref:Uncharacterized protein n=1 Tax=Paracoccidioides brasiliensis (strain Pb18) TaxID=502780 RepID=C1GAH0_PARBD|nr:uncharacterized protein PADG_04256 [Paracoccidioides brasiliensis Pb18]EEH48172.2 hypothetical protein PADG_04256 [Paracoccidioides brasiliensis Pb18]